jgi:hypothetical protein
MPALVDEVAALQELDRRECFADPCTMMVRHIEIEDPSGNAIPLELWDFQREAVMELHDHGAVIVLKARRLGLSWIFLAYALWLAITHQGIRILILCKKEKDAIQLLARVRRMRDRIAASEESSHLLAKLEAPDKVRDQVTVLDIGSSTLMSLVGTPDSARSETAGLLLLDEFAFQRGADEIWQAALPTIEGGGRVGVVSTGNGSEHSSKMGAEFAKQWSRANKGVGAFKALFFPWTVRPDRDEKWKQDTIDTLGSEDRFKVEYPEDPADAFLQADADLIYPGPHMDAVEKLGAAFDAGPGELWLGIDWGVNTHMVIGQRTAGGGLHVIAEYCSTNADLETDADAVAAIFTRLGRPPKYLRYDPGAAGAKVISIFVTLMQQRVPGFKPKVLKIPFAKFKIVAINYTKMLARRAADAQPTRVLSIDGEACPVLVRQMREQEWEDTDASKTEKGDDHGADSLLTLTAELGYEHDRKGGNADG